MNLRPPALFTVLPLLASLSLPLAGCYADVESASKRGAKHVCKRMHECDRSQFDNEYNGDFGRCRDDKYTEYLDAHDAWEDLGCDYDPDDAKTCVETIKALTTDCSNDADREILDACGLALEEIYDCPGLLVPTPTDTVPGQLASPPDEVEPTRTPGR